MKPPNFKYFAVHSAEEAVALLSEHGDEARILAGGQSLVQWMNARVVAPSVLVDVNPISDLAFVRPENGSLAVGAMTRTATIERDESVAERLPVLAEAAARVGHVAVRNRGTVGGNVAHADPAANLPPVMLTLDARFTVLGPDGEREILANEIFLGPHRTSLEADELLTEVRLPVLPSGAGSAFLEISRRGRGWGIVGVAAVVALDAEGKVADARLAISGVGPTAVRVRDAEVSSRGEWPSAETWAEIVGAIGDDLDPRSDVHASAAYRRHLTGVLATRALVLAAARAEGS